jgi:hypothetical protein
MNDVTFALLSILGGAFFCFAGYRAFRIIIPLWAAFVGFSLGAGVAAAISGDAFLATTASWLVGVVGGVAFAFIAFAVYEAAVALAMASIGFTLGASAMVALDVRWSWLVVLAGVVAGCALAVAAIALDLPAVLLLVLTALGGASAITGGIMLLTGAVNTADFDDGGASDHVSASGWWFVLYIAIAAAGVVSQRRAMGTITGTARDGWGNGPPPPARAARPA